jgi:hypothetical protein
MEDVGDGGGPDLAEIGGQQEDDAGSWDDKLARYRELGLAELVRFEPEAAPGRRLRIWDRVREGLVERQIGDDRSPCLTLDLAWTVCSVAGEPVGLRLVDDEGRLLETHGEAEGAHASHRGERPGKGRGSRPRRDPGPTARSASP